MLSGLLRINDNQSFELMEIASEFGHLEILKRGLNVILEKCEMQESFF
jgi:hypothetical protein